MGARVCDQSGVIEPIPAFVEVNGDRITIGHVCGKCRRMSVKSELQPDSRAAALDCCFRHCECGALIGSQSYTACEPCRKRKLAESNAAWEVKARAKAKRIPLAEYEHEWLHWGDEFYSDVDALLDHCDYAEVDPPKDAWACKPIPLAFDVEDMLESALSDHHDEAYEQISEKAKEELQAHLDTWCTETGVVSYEPDYERLVVLEEVVVDEQSDDLGRP